MEMHGFERLSEELNESVYPCRPPAQHFLYRSRFAKKVRVDMWCEKTGCYRTMGAPRVYCERPEQFLKKHSRLPPVYFKHKVLKDPYAEIDKEGPGPNLRRQSSNERRASLGIGVTPHKVEKIPRDFIEENALRVIKMPQKRTKRCYIGEDGVHRVDMSDGPYILKPGFGQVPQYLQRRKMEICAENEEQRRKMEGSQAPPNCQILSDWERCSLISGLQTRWSELNAEFLRLPAYISDKVDADKARLDSQLKQIEVDLRLLNSNHPIFISNDATEPSHFC